jgi:NhaA family Na+:H+ antiporter
LAPRRDNRGDSSLAFDACRRWLSDALWHSVTMTAEAPDSRSTNPFQEFFRTEAAGGALLVACACAALVVANSGWADAYHRLLATTIVIAAGGRGPSLTVHQWINDGLMAVFFLLVGLEIKREALAGELASPHQAALPIAAAIGGMVVPASIYFLTNGGGIESRGWAIPMATDIAFALGVLALVAPRAPSGLKIFLAALAIVDDMGAVLVIALFYTGVIAWGALGMAGLILLLLIALNVFRILSLTPYLVLGLGLWFFVHESGVHATIAGVLLAFAIPTRTRINAEEFSAKARGLLDYFDRTETGDLLVLTSKGQQEAIIGLERASEGVTAPLLRLEHALHGFSAFVVMPLFAFSNAGVDLSGWSGGRVTLAVILGLAVGKPLGITGAALAAVRLRVAALPDGVSWTALHGCAWLGGIGFTMSLFIATLAFGDTALLDSAKVGILGGSILSSVVGAIIVRRGTRSARQSLDAL